MQEFHHITMTTETGSDSVLLLSLIIHTIITCKCTCTQTHRQIHMYFTCITISSNTRENSCDIVSTEVAIQGIVAYSLSSTVNQWVHRAQLKPQKEFLWINPTSPLISYNFLPAHFPAVQLFCSNEHWSMCFGLVERWQRELGGSRVVSTEWEDLRTIISSVHRTSFCGLSRV